MKYSRMIVTFSLLLFAGLAVNAQTIQKITADIPFSFNVGSTSLNAGQYHVGNSSLPRGVIAVKNPKEHQNVAVLTMPKYVRDAPTETTLVFHRYRGEGGEDKYFLTQIWVQGNNTGTELPMSRTEKETAKKAAKRDMITLVVPSLGNRPAD